MRDFRKSCLAILTYVVVSILLSGITVVTAQTPGAEKQLEAMNKLAFLVGEWQGSASITNRDGTKETVRQTEAVQWKLNGMVLMIEGLGKSIDPESKEEKVSHEALAIVSYDVTEEIYRFDAYVGDGRASKAQAELQDDGAFVWWVKSDSGWTIRYTLRIDDDGRWVEIGEFSRDGESWRQFFDMELSKLRAGS